MFDTFFTLGARTGRAMGITAIGLLFSIGAGAADPVRPIEVNQTDGFGNERLVAFTYFMNFDCVHGPFDNFDKNTDESGQPKVAAVDPDQFQTANPKNGQTSSCVVGVESALDPAGRRVEQTEKLFVIVPFFDADGDSEAAPIPGLKQALIDLFGFVPDAFDPTPGVPVQCPEPGPELGLTKHKGDFGTCTMHPKTVDLGPVLGMSSPLNVPLPNHSHIIRGANFGAVWWQIIVVLVKDQSLWPDVDGTRGLTSVDALRAAQADDPLQVRISPDIPSNFFLFFDSRQFPRGSH